MGQKDIAEKILEAYNDVFSDIVNVLLFNGEQVLKENELEDQAPAPSMWWTRSPTISLACMKAAPKKEFWQLWRKNIPKLPGKNWQNAWNRWRH